MSEPTVETLQAELETLRAELKDAKHETATARQEGGDRIARLEGQIDAMKTAPREAEKPKVTDAELDKLVDEGKLTAGEASSFRAKQMRGEILGDVKGLLSEFSQRESARATMDRQIDRYMERFPEAAREGTDERKRLKGEFDFLTDIEGALDNGDAVAIKQRTLKALRATFGPIDRIPDETRENLETHREAGGGPGGGKKPVTDSGPSARTLGVTEEYFALLKKRVDRGEFAWGDDKVKRLVARAKERPDLRAA